MLRPGRRHSRRHSWPPFRPYTCNATNTIDEDPFSFFVSDAPPLNEDLFGHLTADIERSPRSRSLSPFRFRHWRKRSSPEDPSVTAIRRLKGWIARMEQRYFQHPRRRALSPSPARLSDSSPEPTSPQSSPSSISFSIPSPPQTPSPRSPPLPRGRTTQVRPNLSRQRVIRSHSAKPRVWKLPAEEIWPLAEELEEIGLGLSV